MKLEQQDWKQMDKKFGGVTSLHKTYSKFAQMSSH